MAEQATVPKEGKTARSPARAEVVGSLVRPPDLQKALDEEYADALREHRSPLPEELHDDPAIRKLEDDSIREAVERQIECGVDVVTDGEFRRYCFDNALWNAVEGTGAEPAPQVYKNKSGDAVEWRAFTVERRLKKVDSPAAREAEFLTGITDHPFKITFPSGSYELLDYAMQGPGTYGVPAYSSSEEALAHILELKAELVADAVASGAKYIQFDYAFYPHLVDKMWTEAYVRAGHTIDDLVQKAIEMDSQIRAGIPEGVRVSMHTCRGNLQDKWLVEGSLEPLAERFFGELNYDAFLMEWDDPRRQGGFEVLRFVPKDTVIVLGLVSTKSKEMESVDDVVRRVEEATKYLDVDRLAVSTQCGFASSMGFNQVDQDEQWRKLELVAEVADRVWGR